MKSAIKTSEESWIEQQMLEDKKRATDWEATNEAIEEQVARESYLQWLRDQEKQARQVGRPDNPLQGVPIPLSRPCPPHPAAPRGRWWPVPGGVTPLPVSPQPRKASATCSSATAAAASGLEEWSGRSPRPRSAAPSPEHPGLHPEAPGPKPPSPGAPPAGKPPSPCAPGGCSWGSGDPNWVLWGGRDSKISSGDPKLGAVGYRGGSNWVLSGDAEPKLGATGAGAGAGGC